MKHIRGVSSANIAPLLLLCGLIAICDGFDIQLAGAAASQLAAEFRVHPSELGPVMSLGPIGMMVGAFAFGFAGDRIGHRWTLLMCAVGLFSLATMACAMAPSLAWLAAARLVVGVGLGGATVNLGAVVGDIALPDQRVRMVSMVYAGVPTGAFFCALLATVALPLIGWRGMFAAAGFSGLALVACGLWVGRGYKASIDVFRPSRSGLLLELFRGKWLLVSLLVALMNVSLFAAFYLLASWLPVLVEMSGISGSVGLLATATMNLGGVIGALTFSMLVQRLGWANVLSCGFAGGAASLVIAAVSLESMPWFAVAAAFVAGIMILGGQAATSAVIAHVYPERLRGTGLGWGLGVGRAGAILGPVFGSVALSAGWAPVLIFGSAAVPCLLVLVSVIGLYLQQRRIQRASTV